MPDAWAWCRVCMDRQDYEYIPNVGYVCEKCETPNSGITSQLAIQQLISKKSVLLGQKRQRNKQINKKRRTIDE